MNKKQIAMALTLTMSLSLSLSLALAGCGSSTPKKELNVYNWGEYISDGSEGSLDTIHAFEAWYEETYGEAVQHILTTRICTPGLPTERQAMMSFFPPITWWPGWQRTICWQS